MGEPEKSDPSKMVRLGHESPNNHLSQLHRYQRRHRQPQLLDAQPIPIQKDADAVRINNDLGVAVSNVVGGFGPDLYLSNQGPTYD